MDHSASLDHIVATEEDAWHYDIPDGYFDNIGGTKSEGKLELPAFVLFAF